MSMFTRRFRRRSTLAAVAVGSLVATMVTAAPASAVGNGFDPQAVPVTIPGTSTVVDEWKLVGRAGPSAVQVAPQWILASGHAPLGVGGTFTNAYGSATVDRLAGVCGSKSSGCDISVSHLATPINAPGYPPLLQDGVPVEPGLTAAGNTLVVGMGGSPLGRPDAGWTQSNAGVVNLPTLQAGVTSVDGDSGGGAFFYHLKSATGVLQGLMVSSAFGATAGLQQFTSTAVKPFLDRTLPAGTVTWVNYDALGSRLHVPQPVPNPAVTATANSITLNWPAVGAFPAVTGYRAVLIQIGKPGNAQVIALPGGFHTATFTGVPAGVAYGAFVLASNADGESGVPWQSTNGNVPPTLTYPTVVAAGPPPAGVSSLAGPSGPNRLDVSFTPGAGTVVGVTKTEILVGECGTMACSATNPPAQVADSTLTDATTGATTESIALPAGTAPGTIFQVQARESNTVGVSAWTTATATYIPLLPPLPPASVTVTPNTDGSATVSFTAAPDDPRPAGVLLRNYQEHAPADQYEVSFDAGAQGGVFFLQDIQPGQTTTFNVADFGATPGPHAVDVAASSNVWGDSAPVAVTAPLGAQDAGPPVTVVRTPTAPPRPTSVVVPGPVANHATLNTMTWVEPDAAPGQAAPDEFLIVMRDHTNPQVAPIVAEVQSTVHFFRYRVPFANQYDVSVYALSQQAGPSAVATATGEGPGF